MASCRRARVPGSIPGRRRRRKTAVCKLESAKFCELPSIGLADDVSTTFAPLTRRIEIRELVVPRRELCSSGRFASAPKYAPHLLGVPDGDAAGRGHALVA